MITRDGYSKDPNIVPEGIAITFGKEMMENNGGQKLMMQRVKKKTKRISLYNKTILDDTSDIPAS